jgi:hypothetical protein
MSWRVKIYEERFRVEEGETMLRILRKNLTGLGLQGS